LDSNNRVAAPPGWRKFPNRCTGLRRVPIEEQDRPGRNVPPALRA